MARRPTDPLSERQRLLKEAVRQANVGRGLPNVGYTSSGYNMPGMGTVPVEGDDGEWLDGHVFQWDLDAVDSIDSYIDSVPAE